MKVLVTGASGFIGRRLVNRLYSSASSEPSPSNKLRITCITRSLGSLKSRFPENVDIVKADVMNYPELVKAMTGIDIAYYLIHSMEGSSKDWKKFAARDRLAAENFARAATYCGIKRIIYLGGLSTKKVKNGELSEHLRSRNEVGEILKTSSAKVTILRAAVILGQGGGSFQMLQYLVERLPVMICPKWVATMSQPIAVDDVITYLVGCLEANDTEARTYDIGGPDLLTYADLMKRYAKMINKSIRIMLIPLLTPRLSSYWIDLVTPLRASLARPLIDSLKHEAVVTDDSIKKIIPTKLKNFEEAVASAIEEVQIQATKETLKKERTSLSLDNNLLTIFLIAMAAIGFSYNILNARPEIFQIRWLALSVVWYIGILMSLYFTLKATRLGAMTAAIIGWITLAFWLTDSIYTVIGHSFIASSPSLAIIIRNFIGSIIAAGVVVTSHNVFYKIGAYRI
jgi:uncharacterized protein YbjT (DUF2867 family)